MTSRYLTGVAVAAAIAVSTFAAPAAFAQDAVAQNCKTALDALSKDYAATGLTAPTKTSEAIVQGVKGHRHSGPELTVMRRHFADAQRTCDQGKDHESMLHQDVVRALLNLPEVQHPASHHYTMPPKQ